MSKKASGKTSKNASSKTSQTKTSSSSSSRNQLIILGVAAVALLAVVGFVLWGGGSSEGSVTSVGNDELRQLVDDGAKLVDCRTEGEFAVGHIPGAELVEMNTVTTEAEGWDTDEQVVIYCATGSRSAVEAQRLAEMGFEVYDLTAGIVAWDGEVVAGDGSADDAAQGGAAASDEAGTEEDATAAAAEPETGASGTLPAMYEFSTDT
jgi:rhodanese-related sulfurtransferase